MEQFTTVDATWAHFTELDAVEALSVRTSKEVLVHGEVGEHAVQRESSSWLRIVSMVDHVGETIHLCQEASV